MKTPDATLTAECSTMQLRRASVVWLEPRELAHFELDDLLSGGTGVVARMQWYAHAPHLPEPIRIDAHMATVLGTMRPNAWVDGRDATDQHGEATIQSLLANGLLVADRTSNAHDAADATYRAQHWHGLASLWHAESRWEGCDAVGEVARAGLDTPDGLRSKHGASPPMLHDRGDAADRIPLARGDRTALDDLLDARSTCRNFDTSSSMSQAQFSLVLERAFGARGQVHAADDFDVLKKTSPSGGALHPTEAYLIVQRVDGIAPGLYHYRAGDHALQPLPPVEDLARFAWLAVAGQQWFADAHVLVVLAPRFARNFWKYRNHAKAYRVTILDVGHLSQTLLLGATECGLGAFITAAINEVDIERAFGLTAYVDGPLAVCGFGIRADSMTTSELDPNRKVWPPRDA
jgi:putative peptide maturation dehydrogenase